MTCDDACSLWMALTDPSDPSKIEQLLMRDSHTDFRNFYKQDNVDDGINEEIGKRFSVWIPLVGGQKYYFENRHLDTGGAGHWTLGVEIKPTVPAPATNNNLTPGR